jgi:hypothetical protein
MVFSDVGNGTAVHNDCSCSVGQSPPAAGISVTRFGPFPVWALEGRTLPVGTVDNLMCEFLCDDNARTVGDFSVTMLIRLLYLTKDTNLSATHDEILFRLNSAVSNGQLPMWLTRNENNRIYWTENHMILWLSSCYLLRQENGEQLAGSELEPLILHYLKTRFQYGFYEFFSIIYSKFTLAGLLNLIDFGAYFPAQQFSLPLH